LKEIRTFLRNRWDVAKKKKRASRTEVVGFLGVGLDGADGHHRVTQSEHFLLLGGSSETHEQMQGVVIRFDEALEKRGKKLQEASPEEALDLLREALEP
jgi:hypothetical protein